MLVVKKHDGLHRKKHFERLPTDKAHVENINVRDLQLLLRLASQIWYEPRRRRETWQLEYSEHQVDLQYAWTEMRYNVWIRYARISLEMLECSPLVETWDWVCTYPMHSSTSSVFCRCSYRSTRTSGMDSSTLIHNYKLFPLKEGIITHNRTTNSNRGHHNKEESINYATDCWKNHYTKPSLYLIHSQKVIDALSNALRAITTIMRIIEMWLFFCLSYSAM